MKDTFVEDNQEAFTTALLEFARVNLSGFHARVKELGFDWNEDELVRLLELEENAS